MKIFGYFKINTIDALFVANVIRTYEYELEGLFNY